MAGLTAILFAIILMSTLALWRRDPNVRLLFLAMSYASLLYFVFSLPSTPVFTAEDVQRYNERLFFPLGLLLVGGMLAWSLQNRQAGILDWIYRALALLIGISHLVGLLLTTFATS